MGTAQQQKTAVLEREFEFTQQKKQNISVCSAIQIQMFLIKAKLEKHLWNIQICRWQNDATANSLLLNKIPKTESKIPHRVWP